MIFTVENTKGKRVRVTDAKGHEINQVVRYDTQTREVDILVTCRSKLMSGSAIVVATDEDGRDGVARAVMKGSRIFINEMEY